MYNPLIQLCLLLWTIYAGPQQFPAVVAPPTRVAPDFIFAPAPAPEIHGAGGMPRSSVAPEIGSHPGFLPASGPSGSAASGAASLTCSLATLTATFFLCLLKFTMALSL